MQATRISPERAKSENTGRSPVNFSDDRKKSPESVKSSITAAKHYDKSRQPESTLKGRNQKTQGVVL